jgi:hypothetical protein
VPDGIVDLTQAGPADWVHWGRFDQTSVDRKSGAPLIDAAMIGGELLHQYTATAVTYSWNDGTPTAQAAGTHTGIYVLGQGNGFEISAPADRRRRTLRVYLSGWGADFRVTAQLSDGSAQSYSEIIPNPGDTKNVFRLYTFEYSSNLDGQSLTVTWTDNRDKFGGGNVTLESATLQ